MLAGQVSGHSTARPVLCFRFHNAEISCQQFLSGGSEDGSACKPMPVLGGTEFQALRDEGPTSLLAVSQGQSQLLEACIPCSVAPLLHLQSWQWWLGSFHVSSLSDLPLDLIRLRPSARESSLLLRAHLIRPGPSGGSGTMSPPQGLEP